MKKITYYKRIIENKVRELHYHEDNGEYIKGKSYPECQNSFKENELVEIGLDEWLDTGLENKIFKSEDLTPNSSSCSHFHPV